MGKNLVGKTLLEVKKTMKVVGKAAGEVGSAVGEAASNISNHTKKIAKISMLKAEMDAMYAELGKSVFMDGLMPSNEKAMELMRNCSFDSRINSAYTSWPPRYESKLLEKACSLYFEVTGKTAVKSVTHGGLEAGFFSGLNPGLEMLSFAPKAEFIHSVQERLSISSSEEIRRFLRRLVIECGE